MNKYLKLYYIDSLITILLIFIPRLFNLDSYDFIIYYSEDAFVVNYIFIIISALCLLGVIVSHISKFKFEENNLLFPKYYLMFLILIVVLSLIYNELTFFKFLHFAYYFGFILFGYSLLSIYTLLGFKFKKRKVKKNK